MTLRTWRALREIEAEPRAKPAEVAKKYLWKISDRNLALIFLRLNSTRMTRTISVFTDWFYQMKEKYE